jgi:hypothetical protein
MSDISETIETNAPVLTNCNVTECNTQDNPERLIGGTYYNEQDAVRVVTISAGVSQQGIQGGITAEISSEETEGFIRVAMLHCGWYAAASEHLYGSMTFFVPPGWYYRTYYAGPHLTLHAWVEWDLITSFGYYR